MYNSCPFYSWKSRLVPEAWLLFVTEFGKNDLLSFNTHHRSFLLNTLIGIYRKNTPNGESDFMKFVLGIQKGFISHLIKLLLLVFISSQWRLFLQKCCNSKIEYNVDIISKVLEITRFEKKRGFAWCQESLNHCSEEELEIPDSLTFHLQVS